MASLDLLILIITGITLVLTFLLYFEERKKQLALLRSLYLHLDLILENAKGHLTEFHQNKNIPSYYIGCIDSDYYVTRLRNKLFQEMCYLRIIKLIKLKRNLIKSRNKVENINHLLSRILECEVSGNTELKKKLIRELWGTNKYYDDLKNKIIITQGEIKRILK